MDLIGLCIAEIYDELPFGIVFGVLFMFFYRFQKQVGLKKSLSIWCTRVMTEKKFRGTFFMAFYVALVLFRTILTREFRGNTFQYFFTGWGFPSASEKEQMEAIQNVFLLFPFFFMLFYYHGEEIWKDRKLVALLKTAGKGAFFFSLGIEAFQGFFGFGTFQISDLVYNTLGGILGALLYYVAKCLKSCKSQNN